MVMVKVLEVEEVTLVLTLGVGNPVVGEVLEMCLDIQKA